MPGLYGHLNRDDPHGDEAGRIAAAIGHKPWFVDTRIETMHGSVGTMSLPVFDGGKQIAATDDGKVTLLLDGYLSNRPELRQNLSGASSAELALQSYLRNGRQFLEALEGSFTVLVNDERDKSFMLGNDRYGHRPIYYCIGKNTLTFAPELKGVVAGTEVRREIDWQAVGDLFVFGHCWGERTLLADVRFLDGGSYIHWTRAETTVNKYWQLDYPDERGDGLSACIDDLDHAYRASIAGHADIRGERLMMLSGGLDSRMIACYLADADVAFDTMSLRFRDWNSNDAVVARLLAETLDRDFQPALLDVSDPERLVSEFLFLTDGQAPCSYHINALPLAELRQQYGLYIHGNGGNMLFGDYATQYRDGADRFEGGEPDKIFALYAGNFQGQLLVQTFMEEFAETVWNGAQTSFLTAHAGRPNLSGTRKHEWLSIVERMRRSTTISLAIIGAYMEPMCPIYDHYGMVEHIAGVPNALKYDQHWYLENLRLRFPRAAAIPRVSKTIRPIFQCGPGSELDEYTLVTPFSGFYWDPDYLMRNDYKAVYENFLLDPKTLSRPWFNEATIRAMWDEEQGGAAFGAQLGTILAFEYFCRTYID